MQSRLQTWRGVFAGREAQHVYICPLLTGFAAGKFLPAKKIAKKYTLSLKIQHIVCNYKTKKTRRKKNSEKKNLINSARGDDGNSDDACNGGQ